MNNRVYNTKRRKSNAYSVKQSIGKNKKYKKHDQSQFTYKEKEKVCCKVIKID